VSFDEEDGMKWSGCCAIVCEKLCSFLAMGVEAYGVQDSEELRAAGLISGME
jgi:hypothetical protein